MKITNDIEWWWDGNREEEHQQKRRKKCRPNVTHTQHTHTHTMQITFEYGIHFFFFSWIQHQIINGITHPKPFIFQYFIHFEWMKEWESLRIYFFPLPFCLVSCNLYLLCVFFYICFCLSSLLQFSFSLWFFYLYVQCHELTAAHISIFHIILHNMCVFFIADYSFFFFFHSLTFYYWWENCYKWNLSFIIIWNRRVVNGRCVQSNVYYT